MKNRNTDIRNAPSVKGLSLIIVLGLLAFGAMVYSTDIFAVEALAGQKDAATTKTPATPPVAREIPCTGRCRCETMHPMQDDGTHP